MEDYNRDLIAVQALLLSRAVHCVFSSVEMTHLISFFFWVGGDLAGGVMAVILRARGRSGARISSPG